MYCMSVLTDRDQDGHDYAKYISDYCMEKGIVPLIEIYQNQEVFFKQIQRRVSRITGCSRPECSRTSSFIISQMWNYLVQ